MKKILVDGHCDTISEALDRELRLDSQELNFNLEDAKKQAPILQMTAIYVSPEYPNSFERANKIINKFYQEKEGFSDQVIQVTNQKELNQVIDEQKVGLLLTIENGRAIEDKLENIDYFYHLGVRLMSITWNEDNLLGTGALTKQDNGLTKLGKEYIKLLNQKGMIIDVSHASENTFWDTIKITEKPVVATHSCVKQLCNHPRNLSDEQIKQIAKMGGIIGMCYCSQFLAEDGRAGSKEIAKHISYITNLVGIDYIGLGSDFDGLDKDEMPLDMKGIKDNDKLEESLKAVGFHEDEINKIMGENWIRVLKEQM